MKIDSRDRLAELALYIAQRSEGDPNFGKTKLLKLMAWGDFVAYAQTGESISGATYIKLPWGPGPRGFPQALDRLRAEGRARTVESNLYGYSATRVVAVDAPKTEVFSNDQLGIVDRVIAHFRSWNNSEMSEESHREFVGWRLVEEGDEIPYYSVFLAPPKPFTEADREQARKVAAEIASDA